MLNSLSQILTPNSLVLTATQHLADRLSTEYPAKYPQTPILRLSQWITHRCKPSLSESQEHTVWQLIVADSLPYHSFSQQAQIASMAQQAWHLIKQWNIPLAHPAFGNTNDTQLFKQWANRFIKRCKQNHWLDASSAIEAYITDPHNVPKHLILVGFTEFTPQQQRLLNALSARGCQYELLNNARGAAAQRIALADSETEWSTMARWAADYIAKNPEKQVACVVPQLSENNLFIEDIFLKLKIPFTLSVSKTLDTYPLIRCALLILSLVPDQITPELAQALQHSPFIKTSVIEALPPLSMLQSPRQWAIFFTQQLNIWGWPGHKELDKNETLLLEHWKNILKEFGTLDSILPVLSHNDALKRFQTLASTTFVKSTGIPKQIHILTPIEAIGLSFDALWLMGIQDTDWPPAPRPNPFIPSLLQRELRMPYASAEQTLAFYHGLTTELCTQAPYVIISYALRNTEGELRPSALIRPLPEIKLSDLSLSEDINEAQRLFDRSQHEWIILGNKFNSY